MNRLCLASQSPRRAELLARLGVDFFCEHTHIDETPRPNERPNDYVLRMAIEKVLAIFQQQRHRDHPILAADTCVTLNGIIFGKPEHEVDARRMLEQLSDSTHHVLTAVAWITSTQKLTARKLPIGWEPHALPHECPNATLHTFLSPSRVTFQPLPKAWIDTYLASDEPFDKAGAYAVQGRAQAFITHIDGSYSGIMGLPLAEVAALLHAHSFSFAHSS